MKSKILLGFIPVILGGFIYIIFRVESLIMFKWFSSMGLATMVQDLRTINVFQNIKLPNWVLYSLPDALWLFSFNYLLLLVWRFKASRDSIAWLLLAPAIGVFSELGQLIKVLPGTFDPIDLALLLIACILSMLFIKNPIISSKP